MLYYPDSHNYFPKTPPGLASERSAITVDREIALDLWRVWKAKGHPTKCILLTHGNAQNASAHLYNILWMTEEGFEVVAFDYRGYGRSDGKPSPENTVKDTVQVIRQVAKKCGTKPLFAIGQSLGGAVLLRALAEENDLPVRKAIIDSSFLSYRSMARDVLSRTWVTWPFQWLGSVVISDSWAPKGSLSQLPQIPFLVMHGTKDDVVPQHFGTSLFEALPVQKKIFLSIPDARHTEGFFVEKGKYRKQVLDWLVSPETRAE